MNRAKRLFALFVMTGAVIFLAGCEPSAKEKLVGHWRGSVEFDDEKVQKKLDKAGSNKFARALVEKVIEAIKSGTLELELKADNSFTSTIKLGRFSRDGYGNWEVLGENEMQAVVRLAQHGGKIEDWTLRFSGNDSFVTDIPGEGKDLAVFRCNRVQPLSGESVP